MSPESTTADFLPTRATIWILYFLDPRNNRKKTPASYNNTMEDYRTKVVNSHATLSQNISKFTGDTSKNTGKSTSETNQNQVRGPWGGLPPLREPLPGP